ncbi:MAG: Rieske (2Fe-2S) protein [Vicinamibacteria bacterium]
MKAIRADELLPGQATSVMVEGTNVALFNVDGSFHAIENRCIHRGGPLAEGFVSGPVVTCPWHEWQFDVTNGECLNAPGLQVRSFSVSVKDGDVLVDVTGVR